MQTIPIRACVMILMVVICISATKATPIPRTLAYRNNIRIPIVGTNGFLINSEPMVQAIIPVEKENRISSIPSDALNKRTGSQYSGTNRKVVREPGMDNRPDTRIVLRCSGRQISPITDRVSDASDPTKYGYSDSCTVQSITPIRNAMLPSD